MATEGMSCSITDDAFVAIDTTRTTSQLFQLRTCYKALAVTTETENCDSIRFTKGDIFLLFVVLLLVLIKLCIEFIQCKDLFFFLHGRNPEVVEA